jgi:hypothetical protein
MAAPLLAEDSMHKANTMRELQLQRDRDRRGQVGASCEGSKR